MTGNKERAETETYSWSLKSALIASAIVGSIIGFISWNRFHSLRGFFIGSCCMFLYTVLHAVFEKERRSPRKSFWRGTLLGAGVFGMFMLTASEITTQGIEAKHIPAFLVILLTLGMWIVVLEDLNWRRRWLPVLGAALVGALLGGWWGARDYPYPHFLTIMFGDPIFSGFYLSLIFFTLAGAAFIYWDRSPRVPSPEGG